MQTEPYSARERRLRLHPLPDGYGYAFDYATPAGVKLLVPALFSRLQAIADPDRAAAEDATWRPAMAKLRQNPFGGEGASLLTVWLHVINGCNFSCHYCYIPHLDRAVDRTEIEQHSLGRAKLHPMLNGLLEYCQVKGLTALHIKFAGGEPTLNLPLVEEFCREAVAIETEIRITFGMISNGSFEPTELIPLVLRYGIHLSLSADGYEDSHDRIRFELDGKTKRGSWRQLVTNIDALRASGIEPYFLFTVTPGNYRSVPAFEAFAHQRRLGFRLSLVRGKTPVGHDTQHRIAEEIVRFYDNLAETLDVTLPIPRYAAFAEWNLYHTKHVPCSTCRRYFAIDTAGQVATCQMRMDRTYGNAGAEPFARIVDRIHADPANATLSRPTTRQGICVRCEFFHVCASGCPQHNYIASGLLDRPSPWCHVFGTVLPAYIRATARQLQRAVLARQG